MLTGGFRWGMEGDNSPIITPANIEARAQALASSIVPRQAWCVHGWALVARLA